MRTTISDNSEVAPAGGHVLDPVHARPFHRHEEYLHAVAQARAAAAAYHTGDTLLLDDDAYDALLARIAATEAHHESWTVPGSPTTAIGAGMASAGDVEHSEPMLSLDNVFDETSLRTWATRLHKRLGHRVAQFSVEPKVDGLAVCARYVDGRLRQLVTRGDGRTGEDVTSQAHLALGLPARLRQPMTIEVRGEVYMTESDYKRANQIRLRHHERVFANPRSGAAGALRAARDYDLPISFLAYSAIGELADLDTHDALISWLATLGIATTATSAAGLSVCTSIDSAHDAIVDLGKRRGELGFGIDGVVVKANQRTDAAAAGSSSRAPRWAIAYKFPADTRTTTLLRIEVQIGRTGIITPVAVLEPVQVGGVVVTAATLHNFADLATRDVRVGDTVYVRRAGEVIPEITGAKLDARPVTAVPYAPPTSCPQCGGQIDTGQKRWRCVRGRQCGALEAIVYFASRDAMDIEGLGDQVVSTLIAENLLADVGDLYALTVPGVAALNGLGVTSATNLVSRIQASKIQPLSRVLTGLGVRMTGRSLSRRIARHFGSMAAIQAASAGDWMAVDGVGPERAAVFASELEELAPVIAKLAEHGVNMTEPGAADTAEAKHLPLQRLDGTPMAVVMTGTVPGLSRTESDEAVETLGGRASASVSSKTDLVIVGEGAGSKAQKAAALRIAVMSADVFAVLLAAHSARDHDAVHALMNSVLPGAEATEKG